MKEVNTIESKGELVILIGDLNKHVGDIIPGNEADKASHGGHLVRDLIKSGHCDLVNPNCESINHA